MSDLSVAVFGANGPTGRLLVNQLALASCRVTAVTRRPETFPTADGRVAVLKADAFERSTVEAAIEGVDAVVSVLGVPFTRHPVDTFSTGTANIVAAMRGNGVRRLVVVSSTGAHHYRDRKDAGMALRLFEPVISRTIGKTVYDDLRRMEDIVRDSGLEWTIVRPSTLFDADRVSNYTAGNVPPVGAFTARIDLAHYVAALVDDASTIGATPIISTTEGVPTFWQNMKREMAKSK